jgi:hypothetical protein
MQTGFIYLWRDKLRNMYYVGSHIGDSSGSYISSSKWFNGEQQYRPHDFRRRILVDNVPIDQLRKMEYALIATIHDDQFGVRYYNIKCGRKKGSIAWNKGVPMPIEQRKKISMIKRGKSTWNKGKANPSAAENGRKSAKKLSEKATGRKIAVRADGTRYWSYPVP